jgi:TM2 domain-containing membrane protein YozV
MSEFVETGLGGVELSEYDQVCGIDLRNPVFAGFLTWLVPGLGQFYQGRYAKAVIFFLCVVPVFVFGCFLCSDSEVGIARNVYFSWRQQDQRLFFIPQACVGMAAIPAMIQALGTSSGDSPPFGRFMAPPKTDQMDKTGVAPTLTDISKKLHFLFELGTYITVIAGLMNLLAIFDAIDGPLVYRQEEQEKKKEQKTDE